MFPKPVIRLDLPALLVLAAMLVPPEPLIAQATSEQDGEVEIEEIVVRGRLNRDSHLALFGDVSTREIPLGINIVGADQIVRDNAKTLAEILRTDPAYSPGFGSTGMTGGATIGALRGYLVKRYVLNGVPQFFVYNIVPAEVTERVEVLRGPSAFSYGYTSPGGAINVVTKSPPDELLGTLFASVDEYGALGGQLDIGDRIGDDDRFGYRINLATTTGDKYLSNSDQDRQVFGVVVDYRLSDRTVLTLHAERLDTMQHGEIESRRVYDKYGYLLRGLNWKMGVSPPYHFYAVESTTAGLQLDTSISDYIDLTAKVGYSDYFQSWFDMIWWGDLDPDGHGTIAQESTEYSIEDLNFTMFLNGRFGSGGTRHNLSFAVMATDTEDWSKYAGEVGIGSWFDVGSFLSSDYRPADLPYSVVTLGEYGVMLSDIVEIGERSRLLLGVRWSSLTTNEISPEFDIVYPEDKNDEVTPLVGVMYNLMPNLGLYANYATSLERSGRAPADALNANEQMPAIVSEQYEAGLKWQMNDGRAIVDFAVFEITQPAEFFQGPGTLYAQDGEQRNRGAEVVLQGRVSNSLSLAGGVQYLDAEIRGTSDPAANGSQPAYIPEWQGALSAEWYLQSMPGLSLVAVVSGMSVRHQVVPNDQRTGPGFGTGDLGVIYRFELAGKAATAQVRMENVMDREYAPGAGHLFSVPRTMWATLHYELW